MREAASLSPSPRVYASVIPKAVSATVTSEEDADEREFSAQRKREKKKAKLAKEREAATNARLRTKGREERRNKSSWLDIRRRLLAQTSVLEREKRQVFYNKDIAILADSNPYLQNQPETKKRSGKGKRGTNYMVLGKDAVRSITDLRSFEDGKNDARIEEAKDLRLALKSLKTKSDLLRKHIEKGLQSGDIHDEEGLVSSSPTKSQASSMSQDRHEKFVQKLQSLLYKAEDHIADFKQKQRACYDILYREEALLTREIDGLAQRFEMWSDPEYISREVERGELAERQERHKRERTPENSYKTASSPSSSYASSPSPSVSSARILRGKGKGGGNWDVEYRSAYRLSPTSSGRIENDIESSPRLHAHDSSISRKISTLERIITLLQSTKSIGGGWDERDQSGFLRLSGKVGMTMYAKEMCETVSKLYQHAGEDEDNMSDIQRLLSETMYKDAQSIDVKNFARDIISGLGVDASTSFHSFEEKVDKLVYGGVGLLPHLDRDVIRLHAFNHFAVQLFTACKRSVVASWRQRKEAERKKEVEIAVEEALHLEQLEKQRAKARNDRQKQKTKLLREHQQEALEAWREEKQLAVRRRKVAAKEKRDKDIKRRARIAADREENRARVAVYKHEKERLSQIRKEQSRNRQGLSRNPNRPSGRSTPRAEAAASLKMLRQRDMEKARLQRKKRQDKQVEEKAKADRLSRIASRHKEAYGASRNKNRLTRHTKASQLRANSEQELQDREAARSKAGAHGAVVASSSGAAAARRHGRKGFGQQFGQRKAVASWRKGV